MLVKSLLLLVSLYMFDSNFEMCD